jgi:tripartite-type tricarboxylate transporter receptor subunit TctC
MADANDGVFLPMSAIGKIASTLLAWILVTAPAIPTYAASWPTRPVTIIAPYAAGGMADVLARLIAQQLSFRFGQPFTVENRGGGAGAIGAIQVANAQPDGHVLMFTSPSPVLTVPMLQKVSYNAEAFIPISLIGNLPFILGINSSLPPKTFPEFIAYGKSNPGKLNYASAGIGGISHLVSSLFVQIAAIDAVHVPYKSAAPATAALITGEIDMYFGGAPELMQHLSNDRIRILATSALTRLGPLPSIPAVNEFYPGFNVSTWLGLMAPKGTPKEIIDLIAQASNEATKAIAVRLSELGVVPSGSSSAEFAAVLKQDKKFYADAIKAAGIPMVDEQSR